MAEAGGSEAIAVKKNAVKKNAVKKNAVKKNAAAKRSAGAKGETTRKTGRRQDTEKPEAPPAVAEVAQGADEPAEPAGTDEAGGAPTAADPAAGTPPTAAAPEPLAGAGAGEDEEAAPLKPLSADGLAIAKQMKRPNPIPSLVDAAVGAATEPDADSAVWVKAMTQVAREQPELDALREKAQRRRAAILDAGVTGKLPRGAPMARRFAAHELMIGGLLGASVRVRSVRHLGSPLTGASDLGRSFAGIAALMGLAADDAVIAGKGALAVTWSLRQARFGALAATAARSYEELAAAATATQHALALLEVVGPRFPKAVAGHVPALDPDVLRAHRKALGEFIGELSMRRDFMKDPKHMDDWARLALEAPSPLWRYEALTALLRIGLTRQGSDDATYAIARLRFIALQSGNPEMSAAAAVHVRRLDR